MAKPSFTKKVIGKLENPTGRGAMNTFLAVGDVTKNGLPDIVLSGRNGKMVWFENKGEGKEWRRHLIDDIENQECGGLLYDLTGNGYLDVINGGDSASDEISWWENPGVKGVKWSKRVIAKTGHCQFHDTIIGDVTNDGTVSLLFTNQKGGTSIYRIPLPKNPRVSPWPDIEVIGRDKKEGMQPEEGLTIGDIDEDGKNEVIAGTHWYKYTDGKWEEHKFAAGYITTKVAAGDIDGDGKNEILLSEGDPCVYGKTQGGKLSWFKPKDNIKEMWEEHVIEDYLYDAHSLRLADLCGNGKLDILVGEVGVADEKTDDYIKRPPRLMIYENDGRGNFKRHIIDEGTGTHNAWLVDLRNKGVLDIVTKPLHGPEKWNVHVYYNNK